ncbi:hypothetical protein D8B22_06825 [Verminephrobacter aporrectodeae subsp. tuberculatae]|nr:hypothetical protein [Verminephrobacter aporrectodeae subsp. tuberculatae]MCW8168831.1 hypothetical protein [Verminephrobacter aporrectodeae subsp. tuberculatae]
MHRSSRSRTTASWATGSMHCPRCSPACLRQQPESRSKTSSGSRQRAAVAPTTQARSPHRRIALAQARSAATAGRAFVHSARCGYTMTDRNLIGNLSNFSGPCATLPSKVSESPGSST